MRKSGNFGQLGVGPSDIYKNSDNVVFAFFFISPQLILQKTNDYFHRNYHFPRSQVVCVCGGGGGRGGPIAYSL